MNRTQLVFLLILIVIFTPITSKNNTISNNRPLQITEKQSIDLSSNRLQLFASKRFIALGDTITITFMVYNANYSFIPQIKVNFSFGTNQFSKLSSNKPSFFTLQINESYSTIVLQGSIQSFQQKITFYGIEQQPICSSYCLTAELSATQLLVFNNFKTTFQLSIKTDTQWFQQTDMIEVRLLDQNLNLYANNTGVSYYNSNKIIQ